MIAAGRIARRSHRGPAFAAPDFVVIRTSFLREVQYGRPRHPFRPAGGRRGTTGAGAAAHPALVPAPRHPLRRPPVSPAVRAGAPDAPRVPVLLLVPAGLGARDGAPHLRRLPGDAARPPVRAGPGR